MNNFDYTSQNDQQPPIDFNMEPPKPAKNGKGFAIASLILGIAGVFFSCCCCILYQVSIICGILAIVMAFLAKRDNGGKLSGMALAGLILGIVAIILFLCIIIFSVMFNSGMFDEELDAFFYEYYDMSWREYVELYSNGEVPFPIE